MIQKCSSIAKKAISKFYKLLGINYLVQALLEWIYPPKCFICKEETFLKLFCLSCWNTCKFVDYKDPMEMEIEGSVFQQRSSASVFRLPIFYQSPASKYLVSIDPNITASFVMFFWHLKKLPLPDCIVSTQETKQISKCLSSRLNLPMIIVDSFLEVDCKKMDYKVFLFFSWESLSEDLEGATPLYSAADDQKIYLLSLFLL